MKSSALGIAAVASGVASAQSDGTKSAETERIEKQLAKPLPSSTEKLLVGAIQNSQQAHQARMRFNLPENSEPCTIFVVQGVDPQRGKSR